MKGFPRLREGTNLVIAALLLVFAGPAAAGEAKEGVRETVIAVEGMICSSCTAAIEKALQRLGGVIEARADLQADLVRVRYDAGKVTPRRMAAAIREAGYQARWPAGRAPR